jgi:manganese oxidase
MLQHMTPAIVPKVPGLAIQPSGNSGEMHDHTGMGQLVLGITVPAQATSPAPAEWHADRRLKLEISERPGPPRFALQVHDSGQSVADSGQPGLIGPPIILTRGQPTEIEVLNKLSSPTAIHWHGIELESYYDGVPGWSGADKQLTPPIAPGDSFVARMVPPRAGTFIYHTHWHDSLQLTNGLYGPLIVLPPAQMFDPLSDQVFVFSVGDLGQMGELVLINGAPQSKPLQLQAGNKYRFRLINITNNNQGLQVSLRSANGPVDWRVIAKDGADLPAALVHQSKAQMTITVGETYDVEFSSDVPQDLLLDVLRPALKMHTIQMLSFAAASHAGN